MPESVRLIAASPNVRAESERGSSGGIGSVTETELRDPSKLPPRLCTGPQHGGCWPLASQFPLVTQRWKPRTGFVPPCARSYLISTSPAVRTGVTLFELKVVDWLNSKS